MKFLFGKRNEKLNKKGGFMTGRKIQHYIGGEWIKGASHVVKNNPWSGEFLHKFPVARVEEVEAATNAAKQASRGWAKLNIAERAEYLVKMADWLVSEYGAEGEWSDLKLRISHESGKPLDEADIEVIETSDFLRYFGEIDASEIEPVELELDPALWATKRSTQFYDPHGVVAIIKPWNYPLEMICWTLGPALLTGNTVVIKPSERSPDVGQVVAEMAEAVGIPKGVVNVIHGDGSVGTSLTASRNVDYISFTGSVAAGKNVAASCVERLVPYTLELGGNDQAIVLSDADIELTANGLVWGAFCNAGQVCVGTKVALIDDAIFDVLKDKIVEKARSLRLGIDVGPMIAESQVISAGQFVENAKKNGWKLLAGGEQKQPGYFFEPTVLESENNEKSNHAKLIKEECFGPLLPLIRYRSLDDARRFVNDSKFGLGCSIWSKDTRNAKEFARDLNVGMAWINDVNVAFPQAAWGGRKQSGVGYELSKAVLRNYVKPFHLNWETNLEARSRDWWYPYNHSF